jgi:hypothetical protein
LTRFRADEVIRQPAHDLGFDTAFLNSYPTFRGFVLAPETSQLTLLSTHPLIGSVDSATSHDSEQVAPQGAKSQPTRRHHPQPSVAVPASVHSDKRRVRYPRGSPRTRLSTSGRSCGWPFPDH